MFSSTERATRRASADQTTNHSAANMKPNQAFGEHPASGPAPSTAGFHKHDILNKLDPRFLRSVTRTATDFITE
ncbi:hypothetical protein N0V85_006627 [Neurospora sp. IMI 360204]|nr:hypothetical protein N0V85_006627 [Neurospora sp. IMI 360204]